MAPLLGISAALYDTFLGLSEGRLANCSAEWKTLVRLNWILGRGLCDEKPV